MKSDAELLRQFIDCDAQDALTEIVRRHVDLVYSAALRQVGGDAHLAGDVAQQVFLDLVRKAGALVNHPGLDGWLYTSTRYAAANLVRTERRRRKHELEAHTMTDADSTPSEADWGILQLALDEAMHQLNEPDRRAILLRYFQRKPLVEVGRALGVSENAAAKRVERALEDLRRLLNKAGVTSTSAALGATLASQAISAAPGALIASISSAALAVAPSGAVALLLPFMATKTYPLVIAGLVLVGAGIAFYQRNELIELRKELAGTRAQKAPSPNASIGADRATPAPSAAAIASQPAPPAPAPVQLQATAAAPKARTIQAWSNVGRATPAAAMETAIWAAAVGDYLVAAQAIQFAESDAIHVKALFDSLSESARTGYGSPERMASAVLLASATRPIPGKTPPTGFDIVDETQSGPDDVVLKYRWNNDVRIRSMPLHRFDGQWKLMISGTGIEDARRQAMWRTEAESIAQEVKNRSPAAP